MIETKLTMKATASLASAIKKELELEDKPLEEVLKKNRKENGRTDESTDGNNSPSSQENSA